MKKVLGSILFVIYVTIVLTVTILLLSYNEYMCSEINGYTFYIVRDDMLEPDYVKGDLLIIKHICYFVAPGSVVIKLVINMQIIQ